MKAPITLIMTPVEIVGKFTKPFALTIRFFANMIAGHVVVLALISIIFTFASWLVIVPAPLASMALVIMMLEIFVAFLQAFVFSLLVGGVHRADSERRTLEAGAGEAGAGCDVRTAASKTRIQAVPAWSVQYVGGIAPSAHRCSREDARRFPLSPGAR